MRGFGMIVNGLLAVAAFVALVVWYGTERANATLAERNAFERTVLVR